MLESALGNDKTVDRLPFIGMYFLSYLKHQSKVKKFLPPNIGTTRELTISLEGFNDFVISHEDPQLNEAMRLMGKQMNEIKKIYSKEYLFAEPILKIKPNPVVFQLKIAMISRRDYKDLKRKRPKNYFD